MAGPLGSSSTDSRRASSDGERAERQQGAEGRRGFRRAGVGPGRQVPRERKEGCAGFRAEAVLALISHLT